jgi:hypothetical protein
MKYTILLRKVIKEVIGLITIVLFIYTCTKIRSAPGHKRAAAKDSISTGMAVGFGRPVQITGYHPLLLRHGLSEQAYRKRTSGTVSQSIGSWNTVTGRIRLIWAPAIRLPG